MKVDENDPKDRIIKFEKTIATGSKPGSARTHGPHTKAEPGEGDVLPFTGAGWGGGGVSLP